MLKLNRDNTFCINLDRRKDRWERMESVLKKAELSVTRISAIEPHKVIDKIEGTPTQRACAQSHINVWRHILQNRIPYALILEDDISFDKKWKEKLNIFPYDKFDLLMLMTDHYYGNPYSWQKTQSRSWSTGAYIVTEQTAKVLLKIPFVSSDRMLIRFQEMTNNQHCYSYFPYIVCQFSSESEVEGSVPYNEKIIKQINSINYGLENYIID